MIKSLFLKAAPYLVLAGFFIVGYLGFVHIQDKMVTFAEENSSLQSQLDSYKSENEVLKTDLKTWVNNQVRLETLMATLQNSSIKASEERERLNELFQNHRLEKLAKGKPVLIENRFNAGTERIIRMFECATDPSCPNRKADTKNNNPALSPTSQTK